MVSRRLSTSTDVSSSLPVCLSVSPFSQPHFNTETFYYGQLPMYGQPPMHIEFGLDQTMVIRLISLMSKLLKLPIFYKR